MDPTPSPSILPSHPAARWLLFLVVAAGIYFFHGFIVPVLAALVIAFAGWPLYKRLARACGDNNTLAAAIALLVILAVLIVPLILAFSFALQEARAWIDWLLEANRHGAAAPDWIAALPFGGAWVAERWNEYLNHPQAVSEMVQMVSGQQLGNISRVVMTAGTTVFSVALTLLFMLLTLFFVCRDGPRLVAQLDRVGESILPLRWQRFSRMVPATISATVVGMGLIAIGEGIVLGIAYWIAGVPSPVALGIITGLMALIPGGAPLAFTLVSLYLVGSGSPMAGLGLFLWGSIELFIVDKTIRPTLVGGPIKLPFLLTFFGLIGGVTTMGFIGLFIGPVLMALLLAIWREWLHDMDEEQARELAQTTAVEPHGEQSPAG
ncbi:MAG: AI-2E family transporter [Porticoccaceae bacterium]|jgi:predicted PurR-regulated permease PerM|nr:AI-2E family transporter [Porticoccaceae bacterium]HLS97210.1 AI-2E family transporter [Porticoccaceae bacterium]